MCNLYQSVITAFGDGFDSKGEPDWLNVDGELCSMPSTAGSLRYLVPCACDDDNNSNKLENIEELELIWKRAIEMCQSSSLRSFLRKHGRLSSVSSNRGQYTCTLFVANCWCLDMILALHPL